MCSIKYAILKNLLLCLSVAGFVACNSNSKMKNNDHQFTNRLIDESSPYLLQHAHNPVNWYPWGEEALKKAKAENKLLIISIGYSACHWCHVMEEESFEDTTVARIMNDHFIAIKVDREERPDIDDIYMTACNLITGQGGWPLNAVALPDGKPVWAGTYFPKEQWINTLIQFKKLKEENYSRLEEVAERIVAGLKQIDQVVDVENNLDFTKEELQGIGEIFLNNIDYEFGGRDISPKFPMPNNYEFLLKYAFAFPDSRALEAINTTLTQMANGGIYDHLEGGFSRYSVDRYWHVPHFEKMLYDNGQLISLYAQAYKLTKNEHFKSIATETISFVKENWKDKSGGYYSSFDADSEGEEGKFYVWTKSEIEKIITDEKERLLLYDYYTVLDTGNWEGHNILYTMYTDDQFCLKYDLEAEVFSQMKQGWKDLLLEKRRSRVYPGLDDKIICSWNGLLILGLIDAYKAFGHGEYAQMAFGIWKFIEENLLNKDGVTLKRSYKEGKATIDAFLDDYAITISSLIRLYEISFDEEYLYKADKLMKYVITNFKSEESSMFNYTSNLSPPLVARKSELADNVISGSNSITARNLYALGLYLYNKEYVDASEKMLSNLKHTIINSSQPNFYANWCSLFFDMVYPPFEVAVLGGDAKEVALEMMSAYHPNALFLGGDSEGNLQLLKNKLQDGETNIYVCVNKMCKFPVKSVSEGLNLIGITENSENR